MSSFPLATLAPTIDATGISAPSYDDILNSMIASMQSIFGSDIYLTPDTQEYQMLAIFAKAQFDSNQTAIAIYQGLRPTFAQGIALDTLVKINGLVRHAATNSTAIVAIGGVAGTAILGGMVKDTNGNIWDLPVQVTIPVAGTINVTVTARESGAIAAAAHTITTIYNPQLGWQTVDNVDPAVTGDDVETDAQLRQRQAFSTSLPAQTPLQALHAAVSNISGVVRAFVYENDTNVTDGNGLPPHSISVVVQGGDATEIATVIEEKKNPGTGTFGTTSILVNDPMGLPITINFFELVQETIYVKITIQPRSDYVATTGDKLVQAVVDFINDTLDVGEDVFINWLIGVAGLTGDPLALTFNVTQLLIGTVSPPTGTTDIIIPFNKAAICSTAAVTLVVL